MSLFFATLFVGYLRVYILDRYFSPQMGFRRAIFEGGLRNETLEMVT